MKLPPEGGFPVRCFCAGRPLLAVCGRDDKGEPWVHVKAYKQSRLITEMVAHAGTVHIHCRNCLRWHKIIIVRGAPVLKEESEISAG